MEHSPIKSKCRDNSSTFFIISGYTLLLAGFQKKQRRRYLFVGTGLLIVSFFFYHTPRVFVPILLISTILYLYPIWKKIYNQFQNLSLVSFLILSFAALSLVFLIKGGSGRFSQVNIFGFPEVKLVLEEQIREDGVIGIPANITRLFHNKAINYSLAFYFKLFRVLFRQFYL